MKAEIIKLAKQVKISEIGFLGSKRYLDKAQKSAAEASFCGAGDAEAVLSDAKTIIVCAFSYYSGADKGNISRYAQGLDYHKVAREKMEYIVDFLEEKGFSGEAFADTGVLNERLLAKLSGIAFIGKNKMAINSRLGSYFFIGYIITDCEINEDAENADKCAGCGMCIKACPLDALCGGFDENKCLSYITQKKGELSKEEKKAMLKTGTIWGCDICQEVCPHNAGLTPTEIEEFKTDLITELHIDEDISNREFKEKYSNRAFSWRGKNVVLRNQNIIYNRKEK